MRGKSQMSFAGIWLPLDADDLVSRHSVFEQKEWIARVAIGRIVRRRRELEGVPRSASVRTLIRFDCTRIATFSLSADRDRDHRERLAMNGSNAYVGRDVVPRSRNRSGAEGSFGYADNFAPAVGLPGASAALVAYTFPHAQCAAVSTTR